MWSQLEKAEEKLQGEENWPRNFAAKKIVERLIEGGDEVNAIMSEYSFVDEAQAHSVYDEETFMSQQFNMVYVVLTRAMEMLYVFTVAGSEYEPFARLG